MKRLLKWLSIALGGLVGLLVIGGAVLYVVGTARLNKTHEIDLQSIRIPTDASTIARGQHLVEALTFCEACHGDGLKGEAFIEESMMATIYAPNLTAGPGGVGAVYTDADYVRAIRHGVRPDGRGLIIMHSDVYHNLSEEDLAAIIAYVKSTPPVDNETPVRSVMPFGRVLIALGAFDSEDIPFIPAEVIDHKASFVPRPEEGATAEYGQYLMSITLCSMCHGPDLKGGAPLEPGMLAGPDITDYGAEGGWSQEQFAETLRTGVTPYGTELNAEFMPWDLYANLTDDELAAMWQFITSVTNQ